MLNLSPYNHKFFHRVSHSQAYEAIFKLQCIKCRRFYNILPVLQWRYFLENVTHVHVRYTLSPVRLSSVVCLSVTLVRPTQAVQIFGNISTALGTLAIPWHALKILRRSSQGNPSTGELNTRGVAKYSDFGPIDGYISETVQDRRYKLVLITNRKSCMSFRLVAKSVTLNDLERRNGRYCALFQRIRVPSGRTA